MIVLRNVPKIQLMPSLGCLPDPPSSTDLQFSKTMWGSTLLTPDTEDLDTSQYFKPISDQLSFPSCTSNAVVDVVEALEVIDKIENKKFSLQEALRSTPELSRMFAWWNGRNAMDPNKSREITGCYNRVVVDGVARHGVATESIWPYDASLVGAEKRPRPVVRPSISAYRSAAMHTIKSFHAISSEGNPTERNRLLRVALSRKMPIVFALVLNRDFMQYSSGVFEKPTKGPFEGRHAMVITGWSYSKQAYKVRNSWSPYWGEGGYCWLHKDYITSEYAGGMWVMSKEGLCEL